MVIPDREHIVKIHRDKLASLQTWLKLPNGSLHVNDRVTFEAVEDGSIWVRTAPYRAPVSRTYYVAYFFTKKDGTQGFASAYLDADGPITRTIDMKAMIQSLGEDGESDVVILNIMELTS